MPNVAAVLRVVSPCEHGHVHDILELHENAEFWFPACKNGQGRMLYHRVTAEEYPKAVKRT